MNIVLITPSLSIGGGEVFVVRLANALSHRHRVYIIDLEFGKRDPLLLQRVNTHVTIVNGDQKLPPLHKLLWKVLLKVSQITKFYSRCYFKYQKAKAERFAIFLERFVNANKIAIINSHMAYSDWHALHYFQKKQRFEKFIISMHGCYNRSDTDKLWNVARRYEENKKAFKLADHIVILTESNLIPLQGILTKFPPIKIPLGFEKPDFQPTQEHKGTIVFGLVSRAIPRKGWEEAIEATISLVKEGYKCKLILVGASAYQQELQSLSASFPYIEFKGAVSDVIPVIKQFDIGLFTSYIESESYPNVVAEYLSCDKPVIATDIGEVRRMMSDESGELAGELLTYTDGHISTSELISYMRKYLLDNNLIKKKGVIAAQAFVKMDLTACVRAYENIYS